jgi:hypothetical protein
VAYAGTRHWQGAPARSDDGVHTEDTPDSVVKLLKSYEPGALLWANRDHRHLMVVAILTGGNEEATEWLWSTLPREEVRELGPPATSGWVLHTLRVLFGPYAGLRRSRRRSGEPYRSASMQTRWGQSPVGWQGFAGACAQFRRVYRCVCDPGIIYFEASTLPL